MTSVRVIVVIVIVAIVVVVIIIDHVGRLLVLAIMNIGTQSTLIGNNSRECIPLITDIIRC